MAIEFVGRISPLGKSIGVRYIITAPNYLIRWVEAQPMKNCSAKTAVKFIFEHILSRFAYSRILMSDQGHTS